MEEVKQAVQACSIGITHAVHKFLLSDCLAAAAAIDRVTHLT